MSAAPRSRATAITLLGLLPKRDSEADHKRGQGDQPDLAAQDGGDESRDCGCDEVLEVLPGSQCLSEARHDNLVPGQLLAYACAHGGPGGAQERLTERRTGGRLRASDRRCHERHDRASRGIQFGVGKLTCATGCQAGSGRASRRGARSGTPHLSMSGRTISSASCDERSMVYLLRYASF